MKILNLLILALVIFIWLASFLGFSWLETFIFGATLILLVQGGFASLGMLYSFLKPENLQRVLPPRVVFGKGWHKYSLIVPARNEEKVIADTILAMSKINYPKDLYEVLIVVRDNDPQTKETALKAIEKTNADNIKLVTIDGFPVNKAYSLNMGLHYSQADVVAVFDAEDQPHPDILNSVDEVFSKKKVDIVQAGVQLVNVGSKWFSVFNCLEYYFWFKSILPFFSRLGASPLGGNTVFLKKYVLEKLGGWDEECLTEDADIGVRAAEADFKTEMIYVEDMATLEESPSDEQSFIRQRSRWDEGYLQVLLKGNWLNLPTLKQQFLSFYILIQPLIHYFAFSAMAILPLASLFLKARLWLAVFSWLPFYFLMLQFGLYFLGLWDLKKNYNLAFSILIFPFLFLTFIPYQFLLAVSFIRALGRLILGKTNWEKTPHFNIHRV